MDPETFSNELESFKCVPARVGIELWLQKQRMLEPLSMEYQYHIPDQQQNIQQFP
jgi:hypothetical protein